MKVQELIFRLTRYYEPDAELHVEYWDRDLVNTWLLLVGGDPFDKNSPQLTEREWSEVINKMDEGEFSYQRMAAEVLTEIAEEVIESRKEEV